MDKRQMKAMMVPTGEARRAGTLETQHTANTMAVMGR